MTPERNLLQLTRAGVDTPGCCPLLTGVLHHSTEAVRTLIQLLLDAGEKSYVGYALEAGFRCAAVGDVAMPRFGCGTAAMHFQRQNPGFVPFAFKMRKLQGQTWGLLELELRRPDTCSDMLQVSD